MKALSPPRNTLNFRPGQAIPAIAWPSPTRRGPCLLPEREQKGREAMGCGRPMELAAIEARPE